MNPHADILIVTATEIESTTIIDAFRNFHGKTSKKITPNADLIYDELGIIDGKIVFMVRCEMGSFGLGGSMQTIQKAITAFSPKAVILAGIAFGLKPGKQSIGDVLVSTKLMLYEFQRVGTEDGEIQLIPRGPRPDSSPSLISRFRHSKPDPGKSGYNVHFGLLLSGEKLIDNKAFGDQLLKLEPEAIGGEMEGAGLYMACADARVDWIVIKATCDWADGEKAKDKNKNQQLAARNAANYLLHTLNLFSLQYLDNGYKKTLWHPQGLEHDKDIHFVGRGVELKMISEQLDTGSGRSIILLVGPPGIGKTTTAIKYAWQYAEHYNYIFFVQADDPSGIEQDYCKIASLLDLGSGATDSKILVQRALKWMSENRGWLLIMDNVDYPEKLAPYFPAVGNGHILVTSRLQMGEFASENLKQIQLEQLTVEETCEMIIHISGRPTNGDTAEKSALNELSVALGGLPLAIEHVATYIRNQRCSYAEYWQEFKLRRIDLLATPPSYRSAYEGLTGIGRNKAFITTWGINLSRIEAEAKALPGAPQAAAMDLLYASAFLSPVNIPMKLLVDGASSLGSTIANALTGNSSLKINEALYLVHQFSLIEINTNDRTYSIHRLIQQAIRKWAMDKDQRILWSQRVIRLIRTQTRILFVGEGDWPDALKHLHLATFLATVFMEEWNDEDICFADAADLLSQAGFLLTKTGKYEEADRLLNRALMIRTKLFGEHHQGVAQILSHIANNKVDWGLHFGFRSYYKESLQYYDKALRIRIEYLAQGWDHPDLAQIYNDLGIAHYHLSQTSFGEEHDTENKIAEENYLKALRIWEMGGKKDLIGSALFGLSMNYQEETSRREEAKKYFKQAYEMIFIPHMRAHVCRCYGNFLHKDGSNEHAREILYEGQRIAKRCFGDQNEQVLPHLHALVPVLRQLGLWTELEEIHEEIEMIKKTLTCH